MRHEFGTPWEEPCPVCTTAGYDGDCDRCQGAATIETRRPA